MGGLIGAGQKTPDKVPTSFAGFSGREPTQSELEFFRKNPNVSGYAASDNKVVLNPFATGTVKSKVFQNEATRLFLRGKDVPLFKLTPDQQERFATYGSEDPKGQQRNIRETILARILSEDRSAGETTKEQRSLAADLLKNIKALETRKGKTVLTQ